MVHIFVPFVITNRKNIHFTTLKKVGSSLNLLIFILLPPPLRQSHTNQNQSMGGLPRLGANVAMVNGGFDLRVCLPRHARLR